VHIHLFQESLLPVDSMVLFSTCLPQLHAAKTCVCGEAALPALNVFFQLPLGSSSNFLDEATEPVCQILELGVWDMGEQTGTMLSCARMCGVRAIGKTGWKLS